MNEWEEEGPLGRTERWKRRSSDRAGLCVEKKSRQSEHDGSTQRESKEICGKKNGIRMSKQATLNKNYTNPGDTGGGVCKENSKLPQNPACRTSTGYHGIKDSNYNISNLQHRQSAAAGSEEDLFNSSFQDCDLISQVECMEGISVPSEIVSHPAGKCVPPVTNSHPAGKRVPPVTDSHPAGKRVPPVTDSHPACIKRVPPVTNSHPAGKRVPPVTDSHPAGKRVPPVTNSHPACIKRVPPVTNSHPAGKGVPPVTDSHPVGKRVPPVTNSHPAGKGFPPVTDSHPSGKCVPPVTETSRCESVLLSGDDTTIPQAMDSNTTIPQAMDSNTTIPQAMDTQCSTPKASAGSLKERLKKRLQENTGVTSPNSPGLLMEQKRREMIQAAQVEAEKSSAEGDATDLGPFYGLPSKVRELLKTQRGIEKLYDWQDECLNLQAVKGGSNLIYSLPTSGGKTLVAEILILKQLLCKKKDAMLVLPFVSIVQEKVKNMSELAVELDFIVEEYAGSKGKFPPIKRHRKHSLMIATIEKAHSIINSLLEQDRINSLGVVVVDEVHMLGEGGSRGSTLEMLLLKLVYSQCSVQIIGMSATLSNVEDLQMFLIAEVYSNNFRPVKLTEYIKTQDSIFEVHGNAKSQEDQLVYSRAVRFEYFPEMLRMDPDHLLGLVLEVIPHNSCLLFCATKKNCENVAMMLCKLMVKHNRDLSDVKKAERKALLRELHNDGENKICPILQYTVHFGVAYHHSGLTMDERKLIEQAYTDGVLCLLTCTSTLAAGVNLPAKRVILRSPYVATQLLSRSQYKQMVGRAGRAGIDSSGESILILPEKDRHKVLDILIGPVESCHSSLNYDNGKGIRSLLLSAIGLRMTKTTQDVFTLMNQTLLSVQSQHLNVDVVMVTKDALQKLIDGGLVVQKRSNSQTDSEVHSLEVTPLGKATFKGSVDIDYASLLYTDLQKGEESLVLSCHLHLLYLVTPYDVVATVNPSWMTYFQVMMALNPVELKAAELIGVPESYIAKKVSGQSIRKAVDEFTVKRFYLTLMLYDLWKQRTVWEVSERFEQPRGFIQNLLSHAASFASCILRFVQELEEFWPYQELLGNFVKRLAYCVSAELLPLMEIPGVKLGRAKQLYYHGYRSLPLVANADPENIVRTIQQIQRKVARQIVASAKVLLSEKTEALLEEVEELVAVPTEVASVGNDILHTTSPFIDSVPSSLGSSQEVQED